ncbi:MAG: uracil-DNA glycosylase [Clostridia bacterium]
MRDYNGWDDIFISQFSQPYFIKLKEFLLKEYATKQIFPPQKDLFKAFDLTSYSECNVVILGQDPYCNAGQAMGLSFSVSANTPIPPSLYNIKKEIEADLGYKSKISNGDLTYWAKQGVLLLNTVLTVESGKPNSHKGQGWEQFTDSVIVALNKRKRPIVFMLWGNNAQTKKYLITNKAHLVLMCAHPSPLSSYHGFFGCKHFSKANEFLSNFYKEIDW